VSAPFTWTLAAVRALARQRSFFYDHIVVGGPAVRLMPGYLEGTPGLRVETGDMPGVLQRVNPHATRTTAGCPHACGFCGVDRIEPGFRELAEWPNLPVICDNNLLAASQPHFDRVCERLAGHGWADFNQGLDARLLSRWHAERIADIGMPMVRLALDSATPQAKATWQRAFSCLREAGIAKRRIRCYALVGWSDTPAEAWSRCNWIQTGHGVRCLPMWFHELDAIQPRTITPRQASLGWTRHLRDELFHWHYFHRRPNHGATYAPDY